MTSIKGYTDLLLMGAVGEMNESQRRFLSIVRANVDRLSTLVGDLLDISRMESGKIRLETEPVELTQVITQVVSALRAQFTTQRVQITQQIPGDLPRVNGDRKRITQILTNLLENACRYTLPGGKAVISAYAEQEEVQVDVSDTGIGISEEDQKHVFERFYRGDHPVVKERQGTGLGLSIVKSIIDLHGGRIWLSSRLNQGSTFSFTLPVVKEPPSLMSAETAPVEQEGENSTAFPQHLLNPVALSSLSLIAARKANFVQQEVKDANQTRWSANQDSDC